MTESTLAAEREHYIERLSHEVTTLNEKLSYEKNKKVNDGEMELKKKKYKAMLRKSKENEETLLKAVEKADKEIKALRAELEVTEKQYGELKIRHEQDLKRMGDLMSDVQNLKKDVTPRDHQHHRSHSNLILPEISPYQQSTIRTTSNDSELLRQEQ